MPTGDAYSSGHLVLSHFGTCIYDFAYVETNLSRTCLVSGPFNFEHPSVLLFCLLNQYKTPGTKNTERTSYYFRSLNFEFLQTLRLQSKIKVPRDDLNSKSGRMTSLRENDLNFRINASPKWDRIRWKEE